MQPWKVEVRAAHPLANNAKGWSTLFILVSLTCQASPARIMTSPCTAGGNIQPKQIQDAGRYK
jgi:hypothetical protein